MERYEELGQASRKNMQVADHMLTMTYPLVKDPKLLLAVMENIFLALTNSIGALLHYERIYKRVPPFQDTFASKFNLFQNKCSQRYSIDNEHLMMIQEIKDMILQHKKSPVEFTRGDSFVICSEDYRMKIVSVERMKEYILKSKQFIRGIDNIITKNKEAFSQAARNF